LVVDTGLHFKGKSRDWAIKLFADYTWDTSDKVEKEVTRYQSIPGQAVTYMLGQLSIMELKNEAENTLGEKFNLKDFHFQVVLLFINVTSWDNSKPPILFSSSLSPCIRLALLAGNWN